MKIGLSKKLSNATIQVFAGRNINQTEGSLCLKENEIADPGVRKSYKM
jgi:hypothetical protein